MTASNHLPNTNSDNYRFRIVQVTDHNSTKYEVDKWKKDALVPNHWVTLDIFDSYNKAYSYIESIRVERKVIDYYY